MASPFPVGHHGPRRLGGIQGIVLRVAWHEVHAPGFPARLQGVWSKMEAYLARLSLILALCRVAEQGGEERVEARDVVMASGLVDYFKAHAHRVHVGLHGHDAQDLLAKDLAEFLRERGGEWKDEPNVLHEELTKRKSEAVPERPDELSKMVYAISGQGTWLKAEPGWKKNEQGQISQSYTPVFQKRCRRRCRCRPRG